MNITADQIKSIAPYCARSDKIALALTTAMPIYQINTRYRVCAFIAMCCEESAEFNRMEENLNYSSSGLMATWPTRFPTPASTVPYMHNPMALANYVYANRNGNGTEESGDGWRYRGRGFIEVTFRDNYAAIGNALQLPLLNHPELLSDPSVAATSAGDFWQSHALNALADKLIAGDSAIADITHVINGGLNGLDQRKVYYRRALAAIAS